MQDLVLTMSVDNAKVKKGETISLTVRSNYSGGGIAANVPVTVTAISATNRQGQTEVPTATLDGAATTFTGTTDGNGELVIAVKDDSTRGLETTLQVNSGNIDSTQNVIFTVLTSPDTPKANYWGHMVDAVTVGGITYKRPILNTEDTSGLGASANVNNEVWRRFNTADSILVCPTLANMDDMLELRKIITESGAKSSDFTVGWPNGGKGYKTTTRSSGSPSTPTNVNMMSGVAPTTPGTDVETIWVSCPE